VTINFVYVYVFWVDAEEVFHFVVVLNLCICIYIWFFTTRYYPFVGHLLENSSNSWRIHIESDWLW